jgi:hypothetical protein
MSFVNRSVQTVHYKDTSPIKIDISRPELIELFNYIKTRRDILIKVNDDVLLDPKIFRLGFEDPEKLKVILTHPRLETDRLKTFGYAVGIHESYLQVIMWYILVEVTDSDIAVGLLNVILDEYIRKFGTRSHHIGSLPVHYVAYKDNHIILRWLLSRNIIPCDGYGEFKDIVYEGTLV